MEFGEASCEKVRIECLSIHPDDRRSHDNVEAHRADIRRFGGAREAVMARNCGGGRFTVLVGSNILIAAQLEGLEVLPVHYFECCEEAEQHLVEAWNQGISSPEEIAGGMEDAMSTKMVA